MNHRDYQIIKKILQEIEISNGFVKGISFLEFNKSEMLKRAVSMTVINIGELVKNISDETRQQNQTIPWKEIAGFRDITAHKYQTLRMEDVYYTITEDFPNIENQLTTLIEEE